LQGQGCQSLGQNSTEFNFFAHVPRHYTGLLVLTFVKKVTGFKEFKNKFWF